MVLNNGFKYIPQNDHDALQKHSRGPRAKCLEPQRYLGGLQACFYEYKDRQEKLVHSS